MWRLLHRGGPIIVFVIVIRSSVLRTRLCPSGLDLFVHSEGWPTARVAMVSIRNPSADQVTFAKHKSVCWSRRAQDIGYTSNRAGLSARRAWLLSPTPQPPTYVQCHLLNHVKVVGSHRCQWLVARLARKDRREKSRATLFIHPTKADAENLNISKARITCSCGTLYVRG